MIFIDDGYGRLLGRDRANLYSSLPWATLTRCKLYWDLIDSVYLSWRAHPISLDHEQGRGSVKLEEDRGSASGSRRGATGD